MTDWQKYYERIGTEPDPLTTFLIHFYQGVRENALDLGAGNLRNSHYFVNHGFTRVVAIDMASQPYLLPPQIEYHRSKLEHFTPEADTFDLAICFRTLYHLRKKAALEVFDKAWKSLRPGGMFMCDMLDEQDEWATSTKDAWGISRAEVLELQQKYPRLSAIPVPARQRPMDKRTQDWKFWIYIARK